MKLNEAISRIDELKPNGFSYDTKIRWLSELDGKVKAEIIDTHEGFEKIKFSGYTEPDLSQYYTLLIPYPYDDVYIKWLEAQIDYANGEIAKYNNSITLFNTAIAAFANYYNRTHMPLQPNSIRYFAPACRSKRKPAANTDGGTSHAGTGTNDGNTMHDDTYSVDVIVNVDENDIIDHGGHG